MEEHDFKPPTPADPLTVYYKDKTLALKFGVCRATIWAWIKKYQFPKPVKLTDGTTRWRAEDIIRWKAEREKKRRK